MYILEKTMVSQPMRKASDSQAKNKGKERIK